MERQIMRDDHGFEFERRSGTGIVKAVQNAGAQDRDGNFSRVAITVTVDESHVAGVQRVVVLFAAPDSEMAGAARVFKAGTVTVSWVLEFWRHPWIPGHLPWASLNPDQDTDVTVVSFTPR